MSAKTRLMERYMNDYAARWPLAGVALVAERERSAVIVLTNFDCVPAAKPAEALGGLLRGEAQAAPEPPPPFPLGEAEYAELAGTYEGFGCQAVVARDGERLFFVWNRRTIVPFYPIAPRRFHHTWQDWQCEFVRDADGALRFLGMKKTR